MTAYYTDYGIVCNHNRNARLINIHDMNKLSGKPVAQVLWDNVSALMTHHWQEENLNKLARKAKIGAATAQRIKDRETAVRIDTVERVAMAFDLKPWQLLMPDLDPSNVPVSMLSETEKKLYSKLHRMKSIMEESS